MWHAVARLPVSAQIAGVDVLLLATTALVGPLVGVRPLVDLEVVRPAEPLRTYVTSKRLFSRVQTHMRVELGLAVKCLFASFALEVLLSVLPFSSVR